MTDRVQFKITIDVVKGGFVVTYPVQDGDNWFEEREVVSTPRKLNQRIKEVLDVVSLVRDEK